MSSFMYAIRMAANPWIKFGGTPLAALITLDLGEKLWVEVSVRNNGLFCTCLYLGTV